MKKLLLAIVVIVPLYFVWNFAVRPNSQLMTATIIDIPPGSDFHSLLSQLRAQGIDNWDFAAFKHTTFGPSEKLGFEFRAEIFNLFNHVQFAPPANLQ